MWRPTIVALPSLALPSIGRLADSLTGMSALASDPSVPHAGTMEGELPPDEARAASRRARRDDSLLGEDQGQEGRRVYPPQEVQARLQVSASGLRRLAGIFERAMGDLPRDERGRVWPEEAIEILEDAREAVREQRAVSIEAALRGQETHEAAPGGSSGTEEPHPVAGGSLEERVDVGAAILEELRALRMLVEEQSRRIAELEEAVRTGGDPELYAPSEDSDEPLETRESAEPRPGSEAGGTETSPRRRSWWRRFFGFD